MRSMGNLWLRLDGPLDYLHQASDDARLNVRMGACLCDGLPWMNRNARFRARRLKPCHAKKYQSERCRNHDQSDSQGAFGSME